MRTVAQLAELTGIDYETVRYYCTPEKPVNPINGRKGRRGAGLIKASSTRGRWNLYDDDALLDLAIAGLMGKSGMSVEDMRKALSWDSDPGQLLSEQEKRLRKKLRQVDRELRTAGALRRFFEAIESEDDDAFMRSIQDCVVLAFEGLDDRVAKDGRLAPLKGLKPAKELVEANREVESLLRRHRAIQRKGGDPKELDKVNEEIASAALNQRDGSDSFTSFMEGLIDIWEKKDPGDGSEALECVRKFYKGQKQLYENFTPDMLEPYIRAIFTENYLSMMLELSHGEGFIKFVMEATTSYCNQGNAKKED